MLVQGLAVQLPGQLGVELGSITVLHWVCGQVFPIKTGLDHQTETLTLWKVSTLAWKDDRFTVTLEILKHMQLVFPVLKELLAWQQVGSRETDLCFS